MSDTMYEGGCHCGAVRYRGQGPAIFAAFCHCTDCRGTTGAPLVAWVGFSISGFEFIHGTPKRYASSERVERQFCGDCGTPLTCRNQEEKFMDVAITTLDDPEAVRPKFHVFTRSRLDWVQVSDDLPQYPGWKHEGH